MSKEKAKHMPKRTPRRLSWRKVIVVASITLVYLVYLILSPLFPSAMITQTSLPDELRPLAEEILETVPINEYISITDHISLRLEYGKNLFYLPSGQDTICIDFSTLGRASYQRLSQIFINGEKVQGLTLISNSGMLGGLEVERNTYSRCAGGDLEAGLHLIEFHLRDSMWGEPVAIQRWAIEIE